MSVTAVNSWVVDIGSLGPIYPLVGTELLWYIAGMAFWLSFHVLQGRIEAKELDKEEKSMSEPGRLKEALELRDRLDQL